MWFGKEVSFSRRIWKAWLPVASLEMNSTLIFMIYQDDHDFQLVENKIITNHKNQCTINYLQFAAK